MHKEILERLGLWEDESQIYLYLLNNSKQTITDLSRNLLINRPKLYKILPMMEEAWLISQILVWKRKYFIAEDPKVLNNYFETIKKDYNLYIPELKGLYDNKFDKPILKNLKWKKWIFNVYMDVANTLNTGDIFYRYSSRNTNTNTYIARSEFEQYSNLRNKKKLERMVITNDYLMTSKRERLDKEVLIVPKDYDLFEDNITKIIYANKVAIIDYNVNESFIIESHVFAHFEKKLFLLLFKFLRVKN